MLHATAHAYYMYQRCATFPKNAMQGPILAVYYGPNLRAQNCVIESDEPVSWYVSISKPLDSAANYDDAWSGW